MPEGFNAGFVYGTLMRGEANHRLLRGSLFVGAAKTVRGFGLFDHGHFPAMVRMGDGVVSGEVFEITDETLRALDRLEGYPNLYGRELIDLDDGSQAIPPRPFTCPVDSPFFWNPPSPLSPHIFCQIDFFRYLLDFFTICSSRKTQVSPSAF